ncbi:unnamed protein product, partial [Rotaria socialis]
MATSSKPTDCFHRDVDNLQLELFCLIWLDANSNGKEARDTERKLRSIINHLQKFQDVDQCQKFIEKRSKNERVVMIVSGRLGREIVPAIYKLRQVISIYVYCMDKKGNKKWADKFAKVKAVDTDLDELICRIKADHKIQKKVEEPLSISIFNTNAGAVLIHCLLQLKYTAANKNELIVFCKQQYKENDFELSNIQEFQDDYSSGNVLWWYTRDSFFYKTLNAVLRDQNIHAMFLFRSYISDIQDQLKNHQAEKSIKLYRSQMISSDELQTLKQTLGQFISINSFFSTSTDKKQALAFLDIPDGVENLEPVLFEIDADPKMAAGKPFADISPYSDYKDESEVLFMLGSIFRVKSANRSSNNKVWIIQMTLCSDNEHDLQQVLMEMKEQLGNEETNLQTLGKLLWEMSKLDLAEKYFIHLLKQLPVNDPLLLSLYQDLGKLASQTGDLDKSMEWRRKAITKGEKTHSEPFEWLGMDRNGSEWIGM